MVYCRLVRCLVPTFSRTPEFSSSPSQGGSHPEAVQPKRITGERVGRHGRREPGAVAYIFHGKIDLVRVSRLQIEIHTGAL